MTTGAESAVWRVSECRSFADNRFYVDFVIPGSRGWLELVAENLTKEDAERLANDHNATLGVADTPLTTS